VKFGKAVTSRKKRRHANARRKAEGLMFPSPGWEISSGEGGELLNLSGERTRDVTSWETCTALKELEDSARAQVAVAKRFTIET